MKTIWKYELETTDEQIIQLPAEPRFLSVQVQNNHPCIWALVDMEKPYVSYTVFIIGTGECFLQEPKTFIGTYQLFDGGFVGHVFVNKI